MFFLKNRIFRHQTTKLFKTSRLTWQTHDLEIKYSYMTSFKYIVITFFMCNESIEMGHHSSSIVVCFFFQELHTYVVHTYLNVGGGLAVNWRQMVKPTGHQTSHVEVIVVSCKNGLRRRRRIKKCYTGIWCGFVCYYGMAMIMW